MARSALSRFSPAAGLRWRADHRQCTGAVAQGLDERRGDVLGLHHGGRAGGWPDEVGPEEEVTAIPVCAETGIRHGQELDGQPGGYGEPGGHLRGPIDFGSVVGRHEEAIEGHT